jgi:Fic-DOC domain mobile mystery protein B
MYGNVWRWAGAYRKSQKNIGIEYYRIPVELCALIDDCRYWLEHETYPSDEIAARFHHKLVWIHCYPNGDGRHARLATDLLLTSLNRDPFNWGRVNLVDLGATRAAYVEALRAADNHDYGPLPAFVRS